MTINFKSAGVGLLVGIGLGAIAKKTKDAIGKKKEQLKAEKEEYKKFKEWQTSQKKEEKKE